MVSKCSLGRAGSPLPADFFLLQPRAARDRRPHLSLALARTRAFSLVEVVLAIGLATFALLVIFSLMPAGLRSLQEANRQIVETEIFNSLGAELASTKFEEINSYLASRFQQPLYYDNEGLEVSTADEASFFVIGEAYDPEGAGELRRVTVSIGFQRAPVGISSSRAPHTTRRTFLLADRGL